MPLRPRVAMAPVPRFERSRDHNLPKTQGRRSRRDTTKLHAPCAQVRRIYLKTLQQDAFTGFLPWLSRGSRGSIGRHTEKSSEQTTAPSVWACCPAQNMFRAGMCCVRRTSGRLLHDLRRQTEHRCSVSGPRLRHRDRAEADLALFISHRLAFRRERGMRCRAITASPQAIAISAFVPRHIYPSRSQIC